MGKIWRKKKREIGGVSEGPKECEQVFEQTLSVFRVVFHLGSNIPAKTDYIISINAICTIKIMIKLTVLLLILLRP